MGSLEISSEVHGTYNLQQWLSTGTVLLLGGHLSIPGDFFWLSQLGVVMESVLLASNGQKPGMLLYIL